MNKISQNIGRTELVLEWKLMGEDYIVTLKGGREHVGAVAVGLYDAGTKISTSSVISLPGHREENIALNSARKISSYTHKTTVFMAGIHLDDITREEIDNIVETSEDIVDRFIELLEENV
ncbi:MAG: hypothetical protein ACLFMM_04480 [Methanohalobium sp.]|uniref:prenylated flavin chaperone LpdD n=1 Tax=Methanohalobium sp. TaxID=2837493 RepID=UPI00397B541A